MFSSKGLCLVQFYDNILTRLLRLMVLKFPTQISDLVHSFSTLYLVFLRIVHPKPLMSVAYIVTQF